MDIPEVLEAKQRLKEQLTALYEAEAKLKDEADAIRAQWLKDNGFEAIKSAIYAARSALFRIEREQEAKALLAHLQERGLNLGDKVVRKSWARKDYGAYGVIVQLTKEQAAGLAPTGTIALPGDIVVVVLSKGKMTKRWSNQFFAWEKAPETAQRGNG